MNGNYADHFNEEVEDDCGNTESEDDAIDDSDFIDEEDDPGLQEMQQLVSDAVKMFSYLDNMPSSNWKILNKRKGAKDRLEKA